MTGLGNIHQKDMENARNENVFTDGSFPENVVQKEKPCLYFITILRPWDFGFTRVGKDLTTGPIVARRDESNPS